MVRRILTIDFDYIMAPCINLYNHMVDGRENDTVLWNRIEHELNIEPFLCYDANYLKTIAKIIQKLTSNGRKLIPIRDHDMIVKQLLEKYPDDWFMIMNIDFHHDLFYAEDSIDDIEHFDNYSCGNWVGYLLMKDKLFGYSWVKAPNSVPCHIELSKIPNVPELFRRDMYSFQTFSPHDLPKILDEHVDDYEELYFCLSPNWVPYKYHHLYWLLVELFGDKQTIETDNSLMSDLAETVRLSPITNKQDLSQFGDADVEIRKSESGESVIVPVEPVIKKQIDNDNDDIDINDVVFGVPYRAHPSLSGIVKNDRIDYNNIIDQDSDHDIYIVGDKYRKDVFYVCIFAESMGYAFDMSNIDKMHNFYTMKGYHDETTGVSYDVYRIYGIDIRIKDGHPVIDHDHMRFCNNCPAQNSVTGRCCNIGKCIKEDKPVLENPLTGSRIYSHKSNKEDKPNEQD